jgi:RNA polymerase sigma factor (sigma-70 family)
MSGHRLVTPNIGRIFRGETVAGLSEWQLLERYLERRDEIAFEALVARHGPMVLSVCRRMLADQGDVEDAFQATFLVLVRRARGLGPRDAIGPWLHGVAVRVALRARVEAARRRRVVPLVRDAVTVPYRAALVDHELAEILDQELRRLPSKYRCPIVLCYLEGQTHEEAARVLKWPIGTVKGRLARGRDLLRSRLARRGLAPTASAITLVLAVDSSAALRRELLDRTVKSSLNLALGKASGQVASASIASLVEGVVTSMMLNKLKWAGAAILFSGVALVGAGVMARQDASSQPHDPPALRQIEEIAGTNAEPRSDQTDAALPADAAPGRPKDPSVADLRARVLQAARIEWTTAYKDYLNNNAGLERAYQASKRLKAAEEENAAPSTGDSSAPAQSHFDRIRDIARTQHHNPSSTELQLAQVKSFESEAELWLAQARWKRAPSPASPAQESGQSASTTQAEHRPEQGPAQREGRSPDPDSRRVLAKLDERISMQFTTETPLEDVLKYIKQATKSPEFHDGLPIYVDPIGLQVAEKSMSSTVRNMDLEGVPLRRTLQLLLKQIDLVYFVEDGILCITSDEEEGKLGPVMREPSPLKEKIEKAERGELALQDMEDLVTVLKAREEVRRLTVEEEGQETPGSGGFGAGASSRADEAKRNKELIELLIKETRELVDALKASRQTKKAPAGN